MRNERMKRLFERRKHAFVGYLVAGYPDGEESLRVIKGCCEKGIDVLEIGFPAEDASIDGEVIRRAQERVKKGLGQDMAYWRALRQAVDAPIWVMGYHADLVESGAYLCLAKEGVYDALVVPDMTSAARRVLLEELEPYGIDVVGFINSMSGEEELKDCFSHFQLIYQQLYCGPTGVSNNSQDYEALLRRAREACDAKLFAGFGISTPERAEELLGSGFDGVVVGSVIVSLLEEAEESVYGFIERMAHTVRSVE